LADADAAELQRLLEGADRAFFRGELGEAQGMFEKA
jgi:hypothetical protein